METVARWAAHGGVQGVYRHPSRACGVPMTFAAFVPDHQVGERLPVLIYLSGLTCTHANVMEKGDYRAACAAQRIILVAPDTSPRGDGVADADRYDLGQGAGFYVDASEAPWAPHYRMRTYVEAELPALLEAHFSADLTRVGLTGHSMGGHGALTMGLRQPDRYRSVSVFAPIVNPMECQWGIDALTAYLGPDRGRWRGYDACALIAAGARLPELLVDQGLADEFLTTQLRPDRLEAACAAAGIALTLRRHAGYDHSYYFVSTFLAEHVAWHADRMR